MLTLSVQLFRKPHCPYLIFVTVLDFQKSKKISNYLMKPLLCHTINFQVQSLGGFSGRVEICFEKFMNEISLR